MTNVPLTAISQGMIGIDSVHTSRLYAGAPHAGYESEFPPGTEGVEDGCGTTVDGSNETTPRSASFASRQFFLIITLIQARRSSEWSPVDEKNRCFYSNSLFRSRYERTYCQLAILDPRRCTASPSPLDSRERTGQVAFFSIFNPTCPLSSRQVIESSLCICFLVCTSTSTSSLMEAYPDILSYLGYPFGCLLWISTDSAIYIGFLQFNITLFSLSFSDLTSSDRKIEPLPHHISHHYSGQPSRFLAKWPWYLLHPRGG